MIPGGVYRGSAESLQAQLQHQQAQAERAQRHVRRLRRLLGVRLLRLLVSCLPLVALGVVLGAGCGQVVATAIAAWLQVRP